MKITNPIFEKRIIPDFFSNKRLLGWFKTFKDKDSYEYYVNSSYPVMYYMYVLKDKKLQHVYTSLFKNAYVLDRDLVVYRGVDVKNKKQIMTSMGFPFSVTLHKQEAQNYIQGKCCVLTITLPKGTRIVTDPTRILSAELLVEPGIIDSTGVFTPTGLKFDNVKLPPGTVDRFLMFNGMSCHARHLDRVNKTLTESQYSKHLVNDLKKYAKESCYRNFIKLISKDKKHYGIISFLPDGDSIKSRSKVAYMVGEKDSFYELYGSNKNKKTFIGRFTRDDYEQNPEFFQRTHKGDYDEYFVLKYKANKHMEPDGSPKLILRGKGKLTMHPEDWKTPKIIS